MAARFSLVTPLARPGSSGIPRGTAVPAATANLGEVHQRCNVARALGASRLSIPLNRRRRCRAMTSLGAVGARPG